MGFLHQISGDLASAAEYYVRSIESKPSAEAHTFLGWVFCMMGELDLAIVECRKAVRLDPQFGNAWNDLGAYLTEKRRFRAAEKCLLRACTANNYDHPEFPHYNLARLALERGMILRAISNLHEAVRINPGFTPARELLSRSEAILH